MGEVYIKAINSGYVIKGTIQSEEQFARQLHQKLEACMTHGMNRFPVFFDVDVHTQKQASMLLETCMKSGVICAGFLTKKSSHIQIVDAARYAGEHYFYEEQVLLLGDVPRDCNITCVNDVYVLGKVYGEIDVYDADARIVAECFEDAHIRICDSHFQNVTNHAGGILYYDDGELKHQLRRETHGRSDCDHIRQGWCR